LQLSTGSAAVVCQYTDVDTNSRHAAVHMFCCRCLSVHRCWYKQPSRSCPHVLLLLSVSRQMLTQTAVTQLSTGSAAVVCQYTDVDTNSSHTVTAAAALSSQLSNQTLPTIAL